MRSTQQFSVTLPNEMAKMVKARVSSGEYASESEVIRDGLRALEARERVVDEWLTKEVATAYDKLESDPASALTLDQIRQHLSDKHKRSA